MPAFTPYFSEIRFLGSPVTDFIEVALDDGYDPALVSVVVYNANGSIRSTNSLDSSPDNTIAGSDIYTVEAAVHKMGAVALVVDGVVVSFVSFGGSVTATEGAADGMTSDQLGSTSAGESLVSTDMGATYTVDTSPDPGIIPCFVKGTLVETENGPCAIEDLKPGDLVLTQDQGLQPILWVGSRCLSKDEVTAHDLAPVCIPAGALGGGSNPQPARDICVSPAHRILITAAAFELFFADTEVLVAAQNLVGLNGIHNVDKPKDVEYFHLLFETHQLVFTNGMVSESFHPMQQALSSLEAESKAELFFLFPELRYRPASYGPTTRRCLRGYEAPIAVETMRLAA